MWFLVAALTSALEATKCIRISALVSLPFVIAAPDAMAQAVPAAPQTAASEDLATSPDDDDATPRVRLEYELGQGAQACPDEEMMRSSVAARLGFSPFSPVADRTLRVRLFAPPTDASTKHSHRSHFLIAEVWLLEGDELVGERRLESETADCVELSRALQLAMAVAVDPLLLTRPIPPPASPVSPVCPEVAAAPICEEVPPPPPDVAPDEEETTKSVPKIVLFDFSGTAPGEYPKVFGSLGAMMMVQTTSTDASYAPVLNVGVRVHPLVSVAYEGRAETATEKPENIGRLRLQLTTGSIVPCYHQGWLVGCALLTGGVTAGIYRPELSSGIASEILAPYAAIGARAGFEIPIWKFFIRAHLDVNGQILVLRANDVNTGLEYFTQSPISGGFGLAVGGMFP